MTQTRQIHPWFRNIFYLGGFLSLIAGIQLFVLAERTETYFAWTIASPLTASTLGGFYFGTMVFGFLSAREGIWARVRGPALGLFLFTAVSLAATLLHIDKFHLASQNWLTLNATRSWMVIYILLPPLLLITMILQGSAKGEDPERSSKFPAWFTVLLALHGAIGTMVGILLFLSPGSVIPVWAWTLTPLTARALSAWLVSFGVLELHAVWENDWSRVRIMAFGCIVSSLFAMISLVRYAGEINWQSPGGYGYVIHLLVLFAIGAYAWRQAGRSQ